MKYPILLLSLIMLTACGQKLHPLEEPAKFRLPQVVKPEDLAASQPIIEEAQIVQEESLNKEKPLEEETIESEIDIE